MRGTQSTLVRRVFSYRNLLVEPFCHCCSLIFKAITPAGYPCLGVLLQKLENPALRECLKVPTNEVHLLCYVVCLLYDKANIDFSFQFTQGDLTLILKGVLVRRVEPTSDASKVLKEVKTIDLRIFISTFFSSLICVILD